MTDPLETRQETLQRYRRAPAVPVLIIGAGINGAGLFRELALQGVDVLLVDRADFCSGASAASSRMIHGGLRYLEFGEFRLVREAVQERNLLLRNAPHYVRPLRTTNPIFSWFSGAGHSIRTFLGIGGERPARRGALLVKLGLTFYDVFTRKNRLVPRHTFASRAKALAQRPLLNPNLVCTATYHDAWIGYPERLCLEVILDAEALCPEAKALNYVTVQGVAGDSVSVRDELSGETFEVRPQTLVNATGAWIDFTNQGLGRETEMIGGTKGAHLVLDNDQLLEVLDGDMIYYETPDGRVSVALPWLGKALIGSTDIPVEDPDDARCEEDEIDYILSAVAEAVPDVRLERSQIVSCFSGVRPLPRSNAASTVQISRDHSCKVLEPKDGASIPIFSLVGGKWTTFRGFAEQVADQLLEKLGRSRRAGSEDLAIGGGKDYPDTGPACRAWLARLHEKTGLSHERLATLLERYGTRAEAVADYLADAEDSPLAHHAAYTRREIAFMTQHECAVHLDDVVLRRTALALLGDLTPGLLEELAGVMAGALAWSKEEVAQELARTHRILKNRHGIDLASAGEPAE